MELKKINENYTITDSTEVWNVSGNVNKESNGVIRINIAVSMLDNGNHVGNFNYNIYEGSNVNVSFDCPQKTDEALFAYGNSLVDQIIAQLKD